MQVGQRLATKDGRVFGNGIVVRVDMYPRDIYYLIETDFGNQMAMTDLEIIENFHIMEVTDLARWYKERNRCK